jgi:chorismate mutase
MKKLRKEVDLVDDALIKVLEERIKLGKKIVSLKKGNVEDLKREKEIVSRLVKNSSLDENFIKKIYSNIFQCVKN